MEKSTMKNTSSEKTQQLAKGFLSNNRFFMGIKGVHEHIEWEGTFNLEKSSDLHVEYRCIFLKPRPQKCSKNLVIHF